MECAGRAKTEQRAYQPAGDGAQSEARIPLGAARSNPRNLANTPARQRGIADGGPFLKRGQLGALVTGARSGVAFL